jgi:hypothetical protein
MNAKSYAKVMAMKTHRAAMALHWVSMWHHADDGDYESAMTCQLLYLVNYDEWHSLTDTFTQKDWDTASEMESIVLSMDLGEW